MIVSRTPFRLSFAGGGSDLRAFYSRRPGAVVSVTIDKFMYVTVNRRFDDTIRVSYTRTEIVERLDDLRHDLVREALRLAGIDRGVEITTIADIPAGTGLGSSSSLAVGLLNALHAFKGRSRSKEELAREACHLETEVLNKPIGKQDQYAAAYGGLNLIEFQPNGDVFVDPVLCSRETRAALDRRLCLFFTGVRGDNDGILAEQGRTTERSPQARETLDAMVGLARRTREVLSAGDLEAFGAALDQNWLYKKRMHPSISNADVDAWHQAALQNGALGGKLLGAGGAGFVLYLAREGAVPELTAAMGELGLRPFQFRTEPQGGKIVYIGDEHWS